MASSPESVSVPTRDELLALLQGEIAPVKKPPLYFLGLVFVAIVMVLLPIVYVALTGAVAWLTVLHAVNNTGILHGSGVQMRLLSYLGPIFAGGVVVVFMIKPLFARPPKPPQLTSADPKNDPLLFAWVERLTALVGAPMPRRIDVNCDVNASAGLRRGLASMFGRDLVLTIGMPFAGGMGLREFSGVLAHEFGHFAQGGGMRLTYIIRSINFWFARVVYERDAFDQKLAEWNDAAGGFLKLVVGVSRLCVWLSRRVLWLLMTLGHFISCFLLQQMEYDADRYEARVSGSATFAKTVHRIHQLAIAQNIAMEELGVLWTEKKLPDDLPAFALSKADRLDETAFRTYMDNVMEKKTSVLSTHPADRDRIRSAARERAPGLLRTELPATTLFSDFTDLSHRATVAYYESLMGEAVDVRYLNKTKELLSAQEADFEREQGVFRYLQGPMSDRIEFFPTAREGGPVGRTAIVGELERVRDELHALRGGDVETRQNLAAERLSLALSLLSDPQVAAELDTESLRAASEKMSGMMAHLKRLGPSLKEMSGSVNAAIAGYERLEETREDADLATFRTALGQLHTQYTLLRVDLEGISYPFAHVDGEITCAAYAAREAPTLEEPGVVVTSAQSMLALLPLLYRKTLLALVEIAERAEVAVGLERMEAPPMEPAAHERPAE